MEHKGEQIEEIKPVAVAIIELRLSEGINQSVSKSVSQSVHGHKNGGSTGARALLVCSTCWTEQARPGQFTTGVNFFLQ